MFCLLIEIIKRFMCIVNYCYIVIFVGIYNFILVFIVNILKYLDGCCLLLDFIFINYFFEFNFFIL